MSTKWKPINYGDAIKHPLYGVKGWLLLFAIGNFLGPLMSLVRLHIQAREYGITLAQLFLWRIPQGEFIKDVFILQMLIAALVLFLLFSKHTNFRNISSLAWLLFFPFLIAIASFHGLSETGNILARAFFSWAIYCAVWVTYLQRSERVRVTFENCVLSELQTNSAQPFSAKTPTAIHESATFLDTDMSGQPNFKVMTKSAASNHKEIQMNSVQKNILIGLGAIIFLMLLNPPYRVYGMSHNASAIVESGYALILSLPDRAIVDVATLLVQIIGAGLIAGIAYLTLKDK